MCPSAHEQNSKGRVAFVAYADETELPASPFPEKKKKVATREKKSQWRPNAHSGGCD